MRYLFALLLLALWPTAARAEWHEASSEHFIVYADQSESQILEFSQRLERYHSALKQFIDFKLPPPSPSNRVTVFVVGSYGEVGKLYGEGGQSIAGFYQSRPGGSFAVVPRVRTAGKSLDFSMEVLLHEYAHHYLLSNTSFPVPRWIGEGSADYFASASFEPDGGVMLGRPNAQNLAVLRYAPELDATVEEILTDQPTKMQGFYAKSWALYHFLTSSPARKGQMLEYIRALGAGKSLKDAASLAFGDLDRLERDLRAYRRQPKLNAFVVPASLVKMGAVSIRRLSEGEAKAIPWRIRSHRGVNKEQAAAVVKGLRQVAAAYSEEPAVQAALAEAEYDSGNDAAAIAAADKAIARDPAQKNAYIQKGYALFRQAESAPDRDAALNAAFVPFAALNKLEPDHPLPLAFFYRTHLRRGVKPSGMAVDALMQAVGLAPFDPGLRLDLARYQLSEGKSAEARETLLPIAFNPHGGQLASNARAIVDRLAGGTKIDAVQFQLLLDMPAATAEELDRK